jgi:hypothetical protein
MICSASLAGKSREDAIEDAGPAPADEAIVERLVPTEALRGVLPLQAVANDIDDPTYRDGHRHVAHRSAELLIGAFNWLVPVTKGRNESAGTMNWVRRQDEY